MYSISFILYFTVTHVFCTVTLHEPTVQAPNYCLIEYRTHSLNFSGLTKNHEDETFRFDNDRNESIRVHFCRSLVRNCNTKDGYAVCFHKRDGSELGVGREPPEVRIASGKIVFRYTGDKCNETHNYTASFEMRCDYSINDSLYINSINTYSKQSCDLSAVLSTSLACTKSQQFDCSLNDKTIRYDLSPLTSFRNNHIVQINNNLTVIFNVCHSLIFGEHYEQCNSNSAICLVDKADASSITYRNLGQLNEHSRIYLIDGNLQLDYVNGTFCRNVDTNISQLIKSTITFICDINATKSQAEYVEGLDYCHLKFVWKTAAACSEDIQFNQSLTNRKACRVRDPLSNFEYDLSYLMDKPFRFSPNDDYEYLFSVCGAAQSNCTKGSGICKTSRTNPNSRVSGGIGNANLLWTEDGPYLNYSQGDECSKGRSRYTLIEFSCGSSMVEIEEHECYTIIKWATKMLCKQLCSTYNSDMVLDRLIRTSKDYVIRADDAKIGYYMNVCRSIKSDEFFYCPYGAGVCKSTYSDEDKLINETSLGFPESIPTITSNGITVLKYVNGSVCDEDNAKKLSSHIFFICDFTTEQGAPEFQNYHNCVYYFAWRSRMSCGTVDATINKSCTVQNAFGNIWNLSSLQETSVHYVKSKKPNKTYKIVVCGGKKFCNGSFICDEEINFGKKTRVFTDYMNNVVKFEFFDGTTCKDGSRARSILNVKCDETKSVGQPVIVWEQDCSAEFEWSTNAICTPQKATLQTESTRQAKNLHLHSGITARKVGEVLSILMLLCSILLVCYYFYDHSRRKHFVMCLTDFWTLYGSRMCRIRRFDSHSL